MSNPPKDDDEAKFNETLKRMLKAPPKPHKVKDDARDAKPGKRPRPNTAGRGNRGD